MALETVLSVALMKHQNNLGYGFGTSVQWEGILLLKAVRPQKTTQEIGDSNSDG